MNLIRVVNHHIKPFAGLIAAVIVLQVIATAASLALPTLNARIIDQGVLEQDTALVWRNGIIMLAVSAVQAVSQIGAAWLGARTAMGLGAEIRTSIFSRVLSFSTREVNKFGAPSLITRNTNDVQQVQMLVLMSLIMMVSAPIMMVGGVIMALREDVELSAVILVAVIVLGLILGVLITRAIPLFTSMQVKIDSLNRVVREQITGIRVVRAFAREPHEGKRFNQANEELTWVGIRVGRLMALLFPVMMLVMNVSQVAVMWFARTRIDSGELQVGQLTAFLVYLAQILMSVMMATMMVFMAPRAMVSAERIMEVLKTDSSVVPPVNGRTEVTAPGHVRFEDVEFTYPGAETPVLQDINFSLAPGRMTAIIGSTGSGKSTLVNLIPRLFDATGGRVEVGGLDVRELDPDTLWASIGLVPQRAYLFSGTIASNLRHGAPEATEDEMWEALKVAQAEDFVRAMPDQLEAPISQGGTNVSGGQRQRLSIARALIKKPVLYVFDDSFSALDVATDARLREALRPVTRQAAVLIVAQRVATIRHADQIIVLDDGRIVGQGTHAELLDTCPTYVEIVDSQLSIEEAAA
ncbi:ABC transporter ATP-binding protein [Aestuariimicrobium sp. Y1814]|uniref:ABC transporter ATP-binding protein n=1 Tax=Aestuariimicrobium sp. Y1814 TaxID=3418742 RepID=UPI003DA79CC8